MSRYDDITMTIGSVTLGGPRDVSTEPWPTEPSGFEFDNKPITVEVETTISDMNFDELAALFGVNRKAPEMALGISLVGSANRHLRRTLARRSAPNRGRRFSLPVDLSRIPVRVDPTSTVNELEMTVTLGEVDCDACEGGEVSFVGLDEEGNDEEHRYPCAVCRGTGKVMP